MKNNILKGWLLSAIGFTIILFAIAYFFGYKPEFMPEEGAYTPKPLEILIAFVIGIALLLVPPTIIEKKATEIIEKIDVTIIKRNKDESD